MLPDVKIKICLMTKNFKTIVCANFQLSQVPLRHLKITKVVQKTEMNDLNKIGLLLKKKYCITYIISINIRYQIFSINKKKRNIT
jgi:hypothetical protein